MSARSGQLPPDYKSLFKRAETYERNGDLAQAIDIYTTVLSQNGKNRLALQRRTDDFFITGQYEKALADANSLVALNQDQDSYLRRSDTLIKLGQFDAALADINRCLTLGKLKRYKLSDDSPNDCTHARQPYA